MIVGAHFDGGFLDGQTLHLSPNLNCIIGGRGTGKSTALEAIIRILPAMVAVVLVGKTAQRAQEGSPSRGPKTWRKCPAMFSEPEIAALLAELPETTVETV